MARVVLPPRFLDFPRRFSAAVAEGKHALLVRQSSADLRGNIFHFETGAIGKPAVIAGSTLLFHHLVPKLEAVAARTVRLAAVYTGAHGHVQPTMQAGTGLILGPYVLTADQVAPRTFMGGKLWQVRLTEAVDAAIGSVDTTAYWPTSKHDYAITSDLLELGGKVQTMNVGGGVWECGNDVAVLRLDDEAAAWSRRRFGRLQHSDRGQLFAAAEQAQLAYCAPHYLIGFPSIPNASEADEAAALWHSKDDPSDKLTGVDLRRMLKGYERLVMSRGTRMPDFKLQAPQALAASNDNTSSSSGNGRSSHTLLPHFANSLGGMSGGPLLNADGYIAGLHVGGREATGECNMYLGVDHPMLQLALDRIFATAEV